MDLTNIYIFILFTFEIFASYRKTRHGMYVTHVTLNCIRGMRDTALDFMRFFPSNLGKTYKIRMKFHLNF